MSKALSLPSLSLISSKFSEFNPSYAAKIHVRIPPTMQSVSRVLEMGYSPKESMWKTALMNIRRQNGYSQDSTQEEGPEGLFENTVMQREYKGLIKSALEAEISTTYHGIIKQSKILPNSPLERIVKIPPRISTLPTDPQRCLATHGLSNDMYSSLVAWSHDGHIAFGLQIGVYIWTLDKPAFKVQIPEIPSDIISLVFSPKNILAIGYHDGTVVLYDTEKNHISTIYNFPDMNISCMAWYPFSPYQLLVGGINGNLYPLSLKWAPQAGGSQIQRLETWPGHTKQILGKDKE